jgi:hypothetical protein
MAGYVDEILTTSGVTGMSELVSESSRVWFHRVVAQLLYLAKRVRWPTSTVAHGRTCATLYSPRR